MSNRSSVFVLMELLSCIESYMNLPDQLKPYISELSEKCEEYISRGFIYSVDFSENGDKDYQFIDFI